MEDKRICFYCDKEVHLILKWKSNEIVNHNNKTVAEFYITQEKDRPPVKNQTYIIGKSSQITYFDDHEYNKIYGELEFKCPHCNVKNRIKNYMINTLED